MRKRLPRPPRAARQAVARELDRHVVSVDGVLRAVTTIPLWLLDETPLDTQSSVSQHPTTDAETSL